MKRKELLEKIRRKAKRAAKLRRDPRYRYVMGFLVQMGFLHANQEFPRGGNRRIAIRDAIWAGQNLEPRILEVLPAAYARLEKRFDATAEELLPLNLVVQNLRDGRPDGPAYMGVPYEKLRIWFTLDLLDKRTRTPAEKKVACSFRLRPDVLVQLERLATADKTNMTAILEKLILEHGLV